MKKSSVVAVLILTSLVVGIVVAAGIHEKPSIDVERAKEIVRDFVNDPEASVVYERTESLNHGDYIILESKNAEFYVNVNTGVIERVTFKDAMRNSSVVRLSEDEARKRAEDFVKQKFGGLLPNMKLVEAKLLDHGVGKEYQFIWVETIFGVETPNRVVISVNPNTGQVMSYMGVLRQVEVQLKPKVSKEEAIETATKQFDLRKIVHSKAKLSVEYPEKGVQKLVWVVEVEGEPKNGVMQGGLVVVDAVSGEVLLVSPYM